MGSGLDRRLSRSRYYSDTFGNHVTRIDGPLGTSTQLAYVDAGRVIERIGPDGVKEALGYDPQGRLTKVERAGRVMQLGYDASGMRAKCKTPSASTSHCAKVCPPPR